MYIKCIFYFGTPVSIFVCNTIVAHKLNDLTQTILFKTRLKPFFFFVVVSINPGIKHHNYYTH